MGESDKSVVPDWMREIRDAYIESLPGRLEEIRGYLDAAATDPSALGALEDSLHRLHGSAGSYGLDRIGSIASACEELLTLRRRTHSVTEATMRGLRQEIEQIAAEIDLVTGMPPSGH